MMTTIERPRIIEMVHCIDNGFKYAHKEVRQEMKQWASDSLKRAVDLQVSNIQEYYNRVQKDLAKPSILMPQFGYSAETNCSIVEVNLAEIASVRQINERTLSAAESLYYKLLSEVLYALIRAYNFSKNDPTLPELIITVCYSTLPGEQWKEFTRSIREEFIRIHKRNDQSYLTPEEAVDRTLRRKNKRFLGAMLSSCGGFLAFVCFIGIISKGAGFNNVSTLIITVPAFIIGLRLIAKNK